MFRIGDIVIATCERDHPYSITCDGWVGRVVSVGSGGLINVEADDPDDDDSTYTVLSKHFKLLSGGIHNSELLDKMFNEFM